MSTGGRTGFSGCSVDFVVALCGYQRLVNVVGGHCTAVVCGKLCGSAAKEGDGKMLSTGVVRYVSSARYGSCPEASAFPRRFFTVWTDRSTKPLLCGYSGELVTWSMPPTACKRLQILDCCTGGHCQILRFLVSHFLPILT